MLITKPILTALGVSEADADRYLDDLNALLPEYGIDTPLRIAHFLAQVLHESVRMRAITENLNYSAEGLLRVFGKYYAPALAGRHARKPERIANRVYAARMGNGDEASGDGWRFRGRGLIQLTGKENYRRFSAWLGEDVVADPDLVAQQYPVHSAVYYWDSRSLNDLADRDDVRAITRKINGGYHGLADRTGLLDRVKKLLPAHGEPVDPPALPRDPPHAG